MENDFLNKRLVHFKSLNYYILFVQPSDRIYKNYDRETVCDNYFSRKIIYDKLLLVEPNDNFLAFVEMAISNVDIIEIDQLDEVIL